MLQSGGEKLLARLCASAIAFDKHRGGVYFNRGTKLEYDVYETVHGAIGKPASLLADTLVKLSCMYEAFEAIRCGTASARRVHLACIELHVSSIACCWR